MDRVSSLLTAVLNRRGLTAHAEGALTALRTKEWIAAHHPHLSPFVHIRGVKDGELVIACENAVALQECHSIGDSLLQELKRDPACGVVRTLRVERA